jgi:hypothetical protein
MTVEILEQHRAVYQPSYIPQEMQDWANSIGRRLSLTYASAGNLGTQRAYGREVVLFEDLPKELQKIARSSFDNVKKYDGELHLGDCILVSQSLENHQFWLDEAERQRNRLENDQAFQESFNEPIAKALHDLGAKGSFVQFNPTTDTKFSDHVRGGPDLAAEIKAAEEQRRKTK